MSAENSVVWYIERSPAYTMLDSDIATPAGTVSFGIGDQEIKNPTSLRSTRIILNRANLGQVVAIQGDVDTLERDREVINELTGLDFQGDFEADGLEFETAPATDDCMRRVAPVGSLALIGRLYASFTPQTEEADGAWEAAAYELLQDNPGSLLPELLSKRRVVAPAQAEETFGAVGEWRRALGITGDVWTLQRIEAGAQVWNSRLEPVGSSVGLLNIYPDVAQSVPTDPVKWMERIMSRMSRDEALETGSCMVEAWAIVALECIRRAQDEWNADLWTESAQGWLSATVEGWQSLEQLDKKWAGSCAAAAQKLLEKVVNKDSSGVYVGPLFPWEKRGLVTEAMPDAPDTQ